MLALGDEILDVDVQRRRFLGQLDELGGAGVKRTRPRGDRATRPPPATRLRHAGHADTVARLERVGQLRTAGPPRRRRAATRLPSSSTNAREPSEGWSAKAITGKVAPAAPGHPGPVAQVRGPVGRRGLGSAAVRAVTVVDGRPGVAGAPRPRAGRGRAAGRRARRRTQRRRHAPTPRACTRRRRAARRRSRAWSSPARWSHSGRDVERFGSATA